VKTLGRVKSFSWFSVSQELEDFNRLAKLASKGMACTTSNALIDAMFGGLTKSESTVRLHHKWALTRLSNAVGL